VRGEWVDDDRFALLRSEHPAGSSGAPRRNEIGR
jgi:hypothetical protein